MSSNTSPSWTIAKATSGCSPTITVSAPRSRVMWAIVRSRPGGERIHHVDRGDVDDDAVGAVAADPFHQVVAQPLGVGVGERGLHRGDEDGALFQDGYWHEKVAIARVIRSVRRCG